MPTSNIDELLLGAKTNIHPATPEHTEEPAIAEAPIEEPILETEPVEEVPDEVPEVKAQDTDEYGNETSSKTYTEDEVNQRINEAIRDRLSRLERNQHQPSQQQVQQQAAQSGFEYDSNSQESWQQQLESFVEQTVSRMSQKQAQQAHQAQEQQIQREFEAKFQAGMSKFNDYIDVVGQHNISDAMVIATRAMNNPAAFLYTAAKRAPQELQRISNMKDPYAQMVEIGKLDERMKKTAATTKTPKPVGRAQEDLHIPHNNSKSKEPTIEERIAESDARRRALQNQRRR